MTFLKIVFHSDHRHTAKLAHFVLEGAASLHGVDAEIVDVTNLDEHGWEKLHQSDAIIFGSPTYMGSVSGPFKSFIDQTGKFWLDRKWENKIAAGFSVSGHPAGDKLNTLQQISIFAMQHGMIWVGQNTLAARDSTDTAKINKAGAWLGLTAEQDTDHDILISKDDAETAKLFGARVAGAAKRWG